MTQFTATSTGLEVAAALSLQIRGKSILLTGPTLGGIGFETALSIASQAPRLLILAGRSQSKLDAAATEIRRQHPASAGAVRTLQLDLASLQSVRAAAATMMGWSEVGSLDVVIANAAAIWQPTFTPSQEGYEGLFATNYLGHFLLVNLLMPKLRASASPTVVCLSSMAHSFSGIRFEDPNFEDGKTYDNFAAYGQSKTANMLFAVSLAERGLRSFSLHPGVIKSNGVQEIPGEELIALEQQFGKVQWKSLQEGAATTMVAAFDPSIADRNGGFLNDCQLATPAPYASDPELARKLWELSEKMVGEKFE